ncbi:MAG TPA: PIG-L deacetylase family protein [Streptosporangiaceae bacterium]
MLSDNEISRVLVVAAHPDDIDFGSAGTIASFADKGFDVSYLLVTSGDAGGFDPAVPRAEIPAIRQAEQTAAAKQLGVSDVRFLGYSDGRVEPTLELRRDIARVIRQVRPDRILLPTPERNYERMAPSHPDHRAVGSAALDAVYPDARNPFAHPELAAEGLEAWTVREIWMNGGPSPNHFPDVTEMFDKKLAALRAHVSQVVNIGDLEGMLRGWMGATARAGGLPEGRLAEAFQVIDSA